MSVKAAGIRIPDPADLADRPFDLHLVDATLAFVQARLSPHLVDEPSTDSERMASVLADQARLTALHIRVESMVGGLGAVELIWRRLAQIARMWADHPDYQTDFGRTTYEFPKPVPSQVRVKATGDWDGVATGKPLDSLISLDDLDRSEWKKLRTQRRLHPSDHYLPMPDGGVAQVWHLISPQKASRVYGKWISRPLSSADCALSRELPDAVHDKRVSDRVQPPE